MRNFVALFALIMAPITVFASLEQEAAEAFLSNKNVQTRTKALQAQGCRAANAPTVNYIGGFVTDPGVFEHVMLVEQNFMCHGSLDQLEDVLVRAKVIKVYWDTSLPDAANYIVEPAGFSPKEPPIYGGGCSI